MIHATLTTVLAASAIAVCAGISEAANVPAPDPDNGGITLPEGFGAVVFAEGVGRARHLAVRDNGDVYVALRQPQGGGGVVAMRDTDGDGKADITERFGRVRGTGIEIHDGYLYFGENTRVVRWKMGDNLVPEGKLEVVVDGFPNQRAHAAKPIDFDSAGNLIVNIGNPSNACQQRQRTPGSQGRMPCDELKGRGIYRYASDQLNQQHPGDGEMMATGLRHCVAIDFNDMVNEMYVVQHGRDQLNQLFPDHYTAEQNAELPSEEFHLIRDGADAGWPYTYWNHQRNERMIAPEYGGDGNTPDPTDQYQDPIQAFPGHWAPNDLLFYDGTQFPEAYRGGAFIAWHGSWNRAPLRQGGYKVTFSPFDGLMPDGDYETFADGFAGVDPIRSPGQAEHRPMGLAICPEGTLFIADSVEGTIWRVMWLGDGNEAQANAASQAVEVMP